MHTKRRGPSHAPTAILAVVLVVVAIGAGTAAIVNVTETLSSTGTTVQDQPGSDSSGDVVATSSNGTGGGTTSGGSEATEGNGAATDGGDTAQAGDAGPDGTGDGEDGHPTALSQTDANPVVTAPADLPEGLSSDEAVRAVSLWLERHDLAGVVSCTPESNGVASYPNGADPSQPYALPWWHYVTTGTDGSRTEFWLVYDPYEMGPYCTDQSPEGSTQS